MDLDEVAKDREPTLDRPHELDQRCCGVTILIHFEERLVCLTLVDRQDRLEVRSDFCEVPSRLLVVRDTEELIEGRRELDFNAPPSFSGVVADDEGLIQLELSTSPDERDSNVLRSVLPVIGRARVR